MSCGPTEIKMHRKIMEITRNAVRLLRFTRISLLQNKYKPFSLRGNVKVTDRQTELHTQLQTSEDRHRSQRVVWSGLCLWVF